MKFPRIVFAILFTFATGLVTLPALAHEEGGLKVPEGCGDKIIIAPEQCDDGNGIDGDGCSIFCQTEAPKLIFPIEAYCGDGVIDTKNETCDDGNNFSGDGCDSNCQDEVKSIFPLEPECGNAVLIKGEECDDGNSNPGDGCDPACKNEVLPASPPMVEDTQPPIVAVAGIVPPNNQDNDGANSPSQGNAELDRFSTVVGGCSLAENSPTTSPWLSLTITILFGAGFYQIRAGRVSIQGIVRPINQARFFNFIAIRNTNAKPANFSEGVGFFISSLSGFAANQDNDEDAVEEEVADHCGREIEVDDLISGKQEEPTGQSDQIP